jgi:hypothetical protein
MRRAEKRQRIPPIGLGGASLNSGGMRCPAFAGQLFRPTAVVWQKYRGRSTQPYLSSAAVPLCRMRKGIRKRIAGDRNDGELI